MVRSGLQQDVINMYRQGVRNAMSKSPEARPNFMLHLRYHFRNPQLRQRDYTAIEHQLRRMSRTLEMLSEPSTQRIGISQDWRQWWAEEVQKTKTRVALRASSSSSAEQPTQEPTSTSAGETAGTTEPSEKDREQVLKKDEDGRDRDQWAGTLPGRGGT
ncbi:hypothetical protein IAU60_006104 [Kwoniella sp. DSM 27419]